MSGYLLLQPCRKPPAQQGIEPGRRITTTALLREDCYDSEDSMIFLPSLLFSTLVLTRNWGHLITAWKGYSKVTVIRSFRT